MPQLQGITVHVTDDQGNNLPEWGIQHLRQGDRVSAYIQSTTDAAFQVSVQPRIPWIDSNNPPSDNEFRGNLRYMRASSEDTSDESEHRFGNIPLSSPLRGPKKGTVPPYSFIAALFLDGRSRPERKVIIYTDPDDSDFNHPDGKVVFKYRWMQTKDGSIAEHGWVFKDKAIETVFDKLILSGAGTEPKEKGNDEDALLEALESSWLGTKDNVQDEKSKVGQIVVEISRVMLGRKHREDDYRAKLQEGMDDDVNMEEVQGDITHATGFVRKGILRPQGVRVVDYSPYRQAEGVYARFQFFYRSQGTFKCTPRVDNNPFPYYSQLINISAVAR